MVPTQVGCCFFCTDISMCSPFLLCVCLYLGLPPLDQTPCLYFNPITNHIPLSLLPIFLLGLTSLDVDVRRFLVRVIHISFFYPLFSFLTRCLLIPMEHMTY
jgi:hypothetical protein